MGRERKQGVALGYLGVPLWGAERKQGVALGYLGVPPLGRRKQGVALGWRRVPDGAQKPGLGPVLGLT